MTFSQKIFELRKRANLSQEQLAEQLDVSRQSVSKWEGQQSLPETEKLIAISKLFHISLDILLNDEYELDDIPPYHAAAEPSIQAAAPRMTRTTKHLIAFALTALLLVALLVITAPATSPTSTSSTPHTSEQSHRQNQINFRRHTRALMKYMQAQNGKSKGDESHAQAP